MYNQVIDKIKELGDNLASIAGNVADVGEKLFLLLYMTRAPRNYLLLKKVKEFSLTINKSRFQIVSQNYQF